MKLDNVDKTFAWFITLFCLAAIGAYIFALIHLPLIVITITITLALAGKFIYPRVCKWLEGW